MLNGSSELLRRHLQWMVIKICGSSQFNSTAVFLQYDSLHFFYYAVINPADGSMNEWIHFHFIPKLSVRPFSQWDVSVAYTYTNLGAWWSTDVPFTVDGLSSTGLPISGDLMRLNDTFWTNHVILTGWNIHTCINTHMHIYTRAVEANTHELTNITNTRHNHTGDNQYKNKYITGRATIKALLR